MCQKHRGEFEGVRPRSERLYRFCSFGLDPAPFSRVSSAPFALFPRVIGAPVLSRANSGPATLFNLSTGIALDTGGPNSVSIRKFLYLSVVLGEQLFGLP